MDRFSFRPLARSDFPLLAGWLRMPHVARWWDDDPSPEALENDYGGCIDGTEPAEVFIVSLEGHAIGLIQRYRMGAYPQYLDELAPILAVRPEESSIDYLIGPQACLGKGVGGRMIAAFCTLTFRDDPLSPSIVVPVQAGNRASWRALEYAGFLRVAQGPLVPDNPIDDSAHFIYRLERASVRSAA